MPGVIRASQTVCTMADDSISKPFVWSDVPAESVGFKTASRLSTGSVRVEMFLDNTKTKQWKTIVARDPDQTTQQKLRVQTPRFRKFTVKEWPGKKEGDRTSWSGSFSIGDLDSAGIPAKFINDWVKPMETAAIDTAATKSVEWFKKKKSVDELTPMFSSSFNEGGTSREGRPYGPLLKCKLPFNRGKFQCQFFKGDNAKPSSLAEYLELTESGREAADCVAILDYESVWFMGKGFGVTPVLSSLLYWPRDVLNGYSFVPDSVSGTAAVDDAAAGPADAFLTDEPVPKRQKLAAPSASPSQDDDQ